MKKQNRVFLLISWIFLLCGIVAGDPAVVSGKTVTITFDEVADGEDITKAYKEQGVVFHCRGSWPEHPYVKNKSAYAWEDLHAFSGSQVMGGRFFGEGDTWVHWLGYALGYGEAKFLEPTGFVCLYGVGGQFFVNAYKNGGEFIGTYHSKIVETLTHPTGKAVHYCEIEITPGDERIKKIEFGSRYTFNESDLTYFDDLSFHVNEFPVAHAGTSETVYEGETVMLDGTGSVDPDEGDDIVYLTWEQQDGPPVVLSDISSFTPTFVVPAVSGNETALSFKLTVKDKWGFKSSDTVTIDILDNGIEEDSFPEGALTLSTATLEPIAIDLGEGTHITRLEPVDPNTSIELLENMPDDMLYGLIDFDAVLEQPFGMAVVNIYLRTPAPLNSRWYKYQPALGWIDFSRSQISDGIGDGAEFSADRKVVTLYVTDNGDYDDNAMEGVVTDPSGLGIDNVEVAVQDDTGQVNRGDDENGGCFISVASGKRLQPLMRWWQAWF